MNSGWKSKSRRKQSKASLLHPVSPANRAWMRNAPTMRFLIAIALLLVQVQAQCHPVWTYECEPVNATGECSAVCQPPACITINCDSTAPIRCHFPSCDITCPVDQCQVDCPECETRCDPLPLVCTRAGCEIECPEAECSWTCPAPAAVPTLNCSWQAPAIACLTPSSATQGAASIALVAMLPALALLLY